MAKPANPGKPTNAGKPTIPPGKLNKPEKADKGTSDVLVWGVYRVRAKAIVGYRVDGATLTPFFESGLELPPASFETVEEALAFEQTLAEQLGLELPEDETEDLETD